jgi:hypothetical protein
LNSFLVKFYFKRYLKEGKVYLAISLILPLILIITLPVQVRLIMLPFFLPIFGVIGAIMAPALYSEDRSSGFYEFMLSSTKIGVADIFWAITAIAIAFSLIVITLLVIVLFIIIWIANGSIPILFATEIGIYTVPISILASLIVSSISFVSQALTKRVSFVNSPAGVAPIIGVAVTIIPFLTFGLNFQVVNYTLLFIDLGIYVGACLLLFIFILLLLTKRMVRERFLP